VEYVVLREDEGRSPILRAAARLETRIIVFRVDPHAGLMEESALDLPNYLGGHDAAFSWTFDGGRLAWISQSEVWLRDLGGRSKATVRLPLQFAGKPNVVAFAPDGVHLAVGGAGGELKVWNCARKRAMFSFATGSPVLQVAWRRNSRRAAVLHANGEVTIWDLQTIPRAQSRAPVSDAVPAKLDHLRICLATEAWEEYHAVLRDLHSLNLNERQTTLLAAIQAEVKRRTENALKAALDPRQKPARSDPALYQHQLRRVVAMDRGVDYPHAATLLEESIRKRGDCRHQP
jgi:hypothetical protein